MIHLKKYHILSIKHVWYAAFSLVFVFLLAIFFLGNAEKGSAAWYELTGLSPGFQGASCPGDALNWVAVRGDLRDAPTGGRINGTFTAQCKADYTSDRTRLYPGDIWSCPRPGEIFNPGRYKCEGPDATHSIPRVGLECGGGSAGLMGVVCMGGCILPFNLSADAVNYFGTPTWLVNHQVGLFDTLYDEGNTNTANYNIYLDRQACETYSWNDCSGLSPVAKDPWLNVCETGASCTANVTECRGADLCSRNTGCRSGACYDDADTCAYNADCDKGNIIGRIFNDENANGAYDAGDTIIKDPNAPCAGTAAGASVSFSGPQSGIRTPLLCNPDPYYDTGRIPAGTYTVTAIAPLNWIITTPNNITATVPAGGLATPHPWFGMKLDAPPVAVANGATKPAGPFVKNLTIALGNTVYFSSNGSRDPDGGPVTFQWDFTNNGSFDSTEPNPSHTYTSADCGGQESCVVLALLRVTDDEGDTGEDAVRITINPPLRVGCRGTPNPANLNQTVLWDSLVTGGAGAHQYSWSGTDGLSGNTASVQKAYSTIGIKTATVSVTTDTETKSGTCEIEVRGFPIADATVSDSSTGTFTKSVEVAWFQPAYFSGLKDGNGDGKGSYDPDGGSIVKYEWNFADGGTATGAEVSHSFSALGEYPVTLTVTDDEGDIGSDTVTVLVSTKLSVACSVSPEEPRVGDIVRWDANVFGGTQKYTYTWRFDDNDDGKTDVTYLATPTVLRIYNAPGKKTGTVQVISGEQVKTATCSVTVKSPSAFRLFAPFGQLFSHVWGLIASAAHP